MKQRTPQEKKALSYTKDRRNCYGESDKGSRKSIRRNKTFPSRAYRKNINNILQGTIGVIDLEKDEAIDVKAKEIKRRKWKKIPDMPLGKIVRGQLETGERPIRRRLNGAMKNVAKVENTEWIRTKRGWITKKR